MKIVEKVNAARLIALIISLGLVACGRSDGGADIGDNGANPAPSANVFVKTGTIPTDSWGYTASTPTQVMAPSQTEILINEHTLLVDASQAVVAGGANTRVSYSSDITTLTAAARTSAPANADFVSYLTISMGSAKSTLPALSVTVSVGAVPTGTTLTVYKYDAVTGWTSPQTAVVNSLGKITFPVNQLSLWGIFHL